MQKAKGEHGIINRTGCGISFSLMLAALISGCANLSVITYDSLDNRQILSDSSVAIQSAGTNQILATKNTDSNGQAGFNIERGMYRVKCLKDSYFDTYKTINFDGKTTRFPVYLIPKCKITGTVAIYDGSIPSSAIIRILSMDNLKQDEVETKGDGSFETKDLEPGEYLVTAETIQGSFYGEKKCLLDNRVKQLEIILERKEYEAETFDIDPEQLTPESVKPSFVH